MPTRKGADPGAVSETPARPKRPRKRKPTKSTGNRPAKPTIVQKIGRPPIYDQPYHDDHANRMAMFGHTNDELARYFGISVTTLDGWIAQHPSFSKAIKQAREEADAEVQKSLYKQALGYQMPAVKIFLPPGSRDPVIVPYMENIPASPIAAQVWLHNRQPDKWRRANRSNGGGGGEGGEAPSAGGNEIQVKITGGLPDDN